MFKKLVNTFSFYKKANVAFGDIFDADAKAQGVRGAEKKQARKHYVASQMAVAPRHLMIKKESLEIMKTTTNPSTFWGRYEDILFASNMVTIGALDDGIIEGAAEVMKQRLVTEMEPVVKDFIDRCMAAGKEEALLQSLEQHEDKVTPEIGLYLEARLNGNDEY